MINYISKIEQISIERRELEKKVEEGVNLIWWLLIGVVVVTAIMALTKIF